MGRKVQVGNRRFYRSRFNTAEIRTEEQLDLFIRRERSAVATRLQELELVQEQVSFLDDSIQLIPDQEKIVQQVTSIRQQVIAERQYDREFWRQGIEDQTGLRGRAAENAYAREWQADAEAVYIAARVAGVELTPADKRILTPLREGRALDVIWGKDNRFSDGTAYERRRGAERITGSTAESRARADMKWRELQAYRFGDNWDQTTQGRSIDVSVIQRAS
jgi:hypothetical protein